jgi:polysaccharide export outer membrane protein
MISRFFNWGKIMRRYLLAWLIAGLCVTGQIQAQTQSALDYSLAPGDRIEVSVLEDPTLNRQALVRPDGKISLPLAGSIMVAGQTPEAVQRLIRRRLAKDFVQPPNVTVSLASVGINDDLEGAFSLPAFYVLGEVNEPGRFTFDLEKPVTVLQALSLAGGLGVFAARKRVQVRRYAGDIETLLIFNYDAIESGEVLSQPLFIKDGDVIVVPERGLFK